jgi:plastocyanin
MSAPRTPSPALLLVLLSSALGACWDLGGQAPDAAPLPDADPTPAGDGGLVFDALIAGLAFRPGTIEITRGTTVRWTNLDAVAHTVTEGAPNATAVPIFDSPLLPPGAIFEWRFDDAGEWIYYCRTHPNVMRGNIVRVF